MPNIQHKRGTRAALDALVSSSQLLTGQIYFITDEKRLAVATGVNSYVLHTPVHVGTIAPSSPSTGDLWVDTN